MFKKMLAFTALALVMMMTISQISYAKVGDKPDKENMGQGMGQDKDKEEHPGRGRDHAPGQLKQVEGFSDFSESRIRIHDKWLNKEDAPVLKGGRTLIPVRAITEALGCTVHWFNPYAVIISPEEDKAIIFDLETGEVYITLSPTEDLGDLATSEDPVLDIDDFVVDAEQAEIDIPAGIINNRTFVPIRFIAEEFGLTVRYDEVTHEIEIDRDLRLSVENSRLEAPQDVEVTMQIADYVLESVQLLGISEEDSSVEEVVDTLDQDTEYSLNVDEEGQGTVTLSKSYIEGLTDSRVKFVFTFKPVAMNPEVEPTDETILRYLALHLDYLAQPEVMPSTLSFEEGMFTADEEDLNAFGDLRVHIKPVLWNFIGIDDLVEGDDYLINRDDHVVTLDRDYLNGLSVGTHTLVFRFEMNDTTTLLEWVIEVK